MNIENIIDSRLKLQSTQRSLYSLLGEEILNMKEFNNFIQRRWDDLDDFSQYSILKIVGGNFHQVAKKYINNLTKYEIQ